MSYTPIEREVDSWDARQHELAMRDTRVKLAKIEAAKEIKVAKSKAKMNSADRLVFRNVVMVCLLVIVIAVCITWGVTRPVDPIKEQNKKDKYELCMKTESDYDKCEYADN